jgi:hypothetical protein
MRQIVITLAVAGAFAARPALAQGAAPTDSSALTRLGVSGGELWIGYSPSSTVAGVLGRHGGLSLGLAGLRKNALVRASDARVVYYTMDLVGGWVTPLVDYSGDAVIKCQPPKYDCRRIDVIATGFGISPLGLTALFMPDRRVQWRLGANGGALWFNRKTPSDHASQFNFTAAVEAGLQVVAPSGRGVLIVYRLHHLSNGGQADDNLAMLSHVISIGTRWRASGRTESR